MEFRNGSVLGTVTVALVWAFVWALPGGAIEAVANISPGALSFAGEVDMWPQTLGLPGLVAGVLFSVLLLVSGGRGRFNELPVVRSAALGAVSGLAVGAGVVWGLDSGLSSPSELAAGVLGLAALLGAVSGGVVPVLFGYVARRGATNGALPR